MFPLLQSLVFGQVLSPAECPGLEDEGIGGALTADARSWHLVKLFQAPAKNSRKKKMLSFISSFYSLVSLYINIASDTSLFV